MLLESPPPSYRTFFCQSPVKTKSFEAMFSTTRITRIPRRSSAIYPPGFQVMKPRLVTDTDTPPDHIEKSSPIYRFSETKTYFEQCFKVIRQLGKGEFGEALEVESLEDGNRYAIKRALHTFESSGSRRLKLHEAKIHESIPTHPNIVEFEKAWEERGRLYIQTELCGSNLADYRKHYGILKQNELYLVLLNSLKAIKHMHSVDLLHMDVKPANIFISQDGTSCKLGDFGLTIDLRRDSIDCAEEGDKYYMAPEILNNPPTTAADIFSLGVAVLELATNVDLEKDKQSIRNDEIPSEWFGELDKDLVHIIALMLKPNPLERPSSEKLLEQLEQLHHLSTGTYFRNMEVTIVSPQYTSIDDSDWDFNLDDNFSNVGSADVDMSRNSRASVQQRRFCRRLTFEDFETHETRPLKKRRLFD